MKRMVLFLLVLTVHTVSAQTRTVGLMYSDTAKVSKGYILFAPKHDTTMFLIDNTGRKINTWAKSLYEPGQSVYLLENGDVLRSCMTKGKLSTGGGEGGRIEQYSWNDSLVWSMDISTDTYMQHHDIRPLPNGNIIMLVVEKKTYAEAIAAGFNPAKFQPEVTQKGMILPDAVYEVKPTPPVGGTIVWKWSVWDHLIQDFDAAKSNYGVVKDHPELIDAAGDQKNIPLFWNHMNSVDYHPEFDQIMVSVRGNSEVWIIDHSTTTAQAAGHTGGRYGKGGDLLYRWGNPVTYRSGTASDQRLYQQHDAEWIRPGMPGAGHVTVFNNGLGRNYSSIDEFAPPVDSAGSYARTAGLPFGPSAALWTFVATPPSALFAEAISGAHRLPNGNTIIDDGTHGTFLEVTAGGEVVWKYICPVVNDRILTQGDAIPDDPVRAGEKMNAVFRVYKYPPEYPAFKGRSLVPGDFVERYPSSVSRTGLSVPVTLSLSQNYPNPFNPSTTIRYALPASAAVTLEVFDMIGRRIAVLVDQKWKEAGDYAVTFDASGIPSGVYVYRLTAGGKSAVKRMTFIQ